jgi:hypothetical protein
MNNYLSLNLVNGRLGRIAGGGRPKFVLDEQNKVQLYVLDFPKPSTYPINSLADAYAYEIIPRDFSGSSVMLKAGVRGGSTILATSSLSNLPTNLTINSNSNANKYVSGGGFQVVYDASFNISSSPKSGSLFSVTSTITSTESSTVTSNIFSFENTLSEISNAIVQAVATSSFIAFGPLSGASFLQDDIFFQASDYSYSFSAKQRVINLPNPVTFTLTLNSVNASSNPGKYGYLDFSSSEWDSVIGTKVETPIWMEAMIGEETISQGSAIICRKMT